MRLWHQFLIPYLDNKRLLSQHRECCALRGKGWGKKHSVVDYVFKYDLAHLYAYHRIVMHEMEKRRYTVDGHWYNRCYRGKSLRNASLDDVGAYLLDDVGAYLGKGLFDPSLDPVDACIKAKGALIYPEHDLAYLKECLLNLKSKGASLIKCGLIDLLLVKLDLLAIEGSAS